MTNKNLDGIKKPKNVKRVTVLLKAKQRVNIDGLVVRQKEKPVLKKTKSIVSPSRTVLKQSPKKVRSFIFWQKFSRVRQVSITAAVVALLFAFGGGVWATLATNKSSADNEPQVLAAETVEPGGSIEMPGAQMPQQNSSTVSNDVLFNTPIEYLQNYLANISQPGIIEKRKDQLTQFLKDRHSPLASASESIAQQEHWKLILAIAFAESTLGKNCADFNCSNIGVKPGHPLWHQYTSYQAWIVDFNRLLDKRYKDWTLEQMCGVYVKPCNANWLLATKQILADLKDRGIE